MTRDLIEALEGGQAGLGAAALAFLRGNLGEGLRADSNAQPGAEQEAPGTEPAQGATRAPNAAAREFIAQTSASHRGH
ncbi:MAG: hypothetical protein HC848_02440 [Limnobacter sp.]|nr:hypothetical protein [Limnobacter sp.]